jgi:hypothetical protein
MHARGIVGAVAPLNDDFQVEELVFKLVQIFHSIIYHALVMFAFKMTI